MHRTLFGFYSCEVSNPPEVLLQTSQPLATTRGTERLLWSLWFQRRNARWVAWMFAAVGTFFMKPLIYSVATNINTPIIRYLQLVTAVTMGRQIRLQWWFSDINFFFFNQKVNFWYQKIISNIRKCVNFWCRKMCEFLIFDNHFLISEHHFLTSEIIILCQEWFSDIKMSRFLTSEIIFGYQKLFSDKKNHFWYQKNGISHGVC